MSIARYKKALAALFVCVLAGGAPVAALDKPVKLTMSTQGVGTAMYMYASAIANVFTKELPEGSRVDLETTSPGGVGAPVILDRGRCDIVLGNAVPAKWACESGILGSAPTKNVRSLAGGLGNDFVNVLFTKDFVDRTGITTVEEVVAKKHPVRIAIKANGAFGEMACAKVLEVLGASYDDVKSWGGSVTQTGSDAIVSLLKDGKADMTIDHVGAGQSATTELCMTTTMFFPQLAEATRDKLNAVGFADAVIPANTWRGQSEAIQSVGSPQVVLISANLPNDVVYVLAEAMDKGAPEMAKSNATLASFNPPTAWDPLKCGAPLHPGAEEYYKAKGYMK